MIYGNTPNLVSPGGSRKIEVGSSSLFVKLPSAATSNGFSITEYELPAGFPGPPAHKHKVFEHAWYIVEGELSLQVEDQLHVFPKGGFIFIPKLTVYAFANRSKQMGKVLVIDTPGGFERYYDDLQEVFGEGKAIDQEKMREIQLKYDTYPPHYVF